MKFKFWTILVLLFLTVFSQIDCASRCINCREYRADDRKTVSIILSGIAQIANGLALIFGKSDKESQNEGVCNLVAGACTVAAQASKSNNFESSEDNPADLYAILNDPSILASVIEILKKEGILIDFDQLEKNINELKLV